MISEVLQMSKADIADLISSGGEFNLTENESEAFELCLRSTTSVWLGKVNGEWVCIWGLMQPSLADNRAYLWLHVSERVREYEFTFVRRSQIAVREMLKQYPVIYGHCQVGAKQSIRWVKWLGGVFSDPQGTLIPFKIVRLNG